MRQAGTIGLAALLALTLAVGSAAAKKTRVWLGIEPRDVDYELIDDYDLDIRYGVFVEGVFEDTPAEEAGIEEHDIIILLDGKKVTDTDDLYDVLETHEPGEQVVVTVLRDGKQQEVTAKLERAKRRYQYGSSGRGKVWTFGGDWDFDWDDEDDDDKDLGRYFLATDDHGYVGMTLTDLTEQLGEHFGVERGHGALVVEIEEDSPAAKAGLKAGDVITAVDGRRARDAEDVSDEIGEFEEGDKVELTVMRDRKEQKMVVEVEEDGRRMRWNDYYYLELPDPPAIPAMPDLPSLPSLPAPPASWSTRLLNSSDGYGRALQDYYRQLGHQDGELKEELSDLQDELKSLRRELKDQLRETDSDMK